MIIELPTHLPMGVRKPKLVPLNLNHYRNADFNLLNNMKILFDKMVKPRLKDVPPMDKVVLSYRLFMPSKRACDVSNVCCIVDKFFSDTLTNAGVISDDNSDVISEVTYHWGGVDKDNPRVEVTLEGKKKPMKITTIINMSHEELIEAIKDYCYRSGIRQESALEVDFDYDSGDDAYKAIITIGDSVEIAPTADTLPEKPARRGPGRPPKAAQTEAAPTQKAEPEPEAEPEVEAPKHSEIEPIPMPSEETETIESPVHVDEPEDTIEAEPEKAPEVAQEAAVAPVTPSKGLFPSKATSSPSPAPVAQTAAPAPKPAGNPKSLFANLKPPVNK